MTVFVDFPDLVLEVLDTKSSDDAADCLAPAAVMKLYATGRSFVNVAAESAGNGRVEFMDRLAKRGGVFGQTPEGLVQRLAFRPSLRS
ncbi:MAG TPA: hypothetical protein VJ860_17910 [Polyangia bacterium]|jgi:hypothetical protein|nr:hypothetical protein [Polyangia bacterium]